MEATPSERDLVDNFKSGNLLLIYSRSDSDIPPKLVLPTCVVQGHLQCYELSNVCVVSQEPYQYYISGCLSDELYFESSIGENLLSSAVNQEFAQLFGPLRPLSDFGFNELELIVNPDADVLLARVTQGKCPLPGCDDGWLDPADEVYSCPGIEERMWQEASQHILDRICPCCVGISYTVEFEQYAKRVMTARPMNEASESEVFEDLNERRDFLGYTAAQPGTSYDGHHVDPAGRRRNDGSPTAAETERQRQSTPSRTWESTPVSDDAKTDIIRLTMSNIQRSRVPLTDDKCLICQDDFDNNAVVLRLRCQQIFHDSCLERNMQSQDTCPQCRAGIVAKPRDLERYIDIGGIELALCKVCQKVSRGHMICCGDDNCPNVHPTAWYHVDCVDVQEQFRDGNWSCSDCWQDSGED